MLRYVVRRILVAAPILVVVSTLSFFLFQLIPGNPARTILGTMATQDQVDNLTAELGLNDPLPVQFLNWMGNAATGDFGSSFVSGQPVVTAILQAVPPTLSLAFLATLVSLLLGMGLGVLAALRRGLIDRIVYTFCSFLNAVPNYWIAAILILLFGVYLGWLPVGGYASSDDPSQWLVYLVLPVLAISLGGVARLTFQTRAAVVDVLSRDYVRTLRAAGISRTKIIAKHVLRNSAIPVVTVTSLTFVFLLGGVVVIETIFTMPGMGTLILRAVHSGDVPVMQGAIIFFSIIVIVVNLLTDLATAAIDPRVRLS